MTHFTNFCTSCGVFDTLTFTPEENAKIKRFDETITAVWERAHQGRPLMTIVKPTSLGTLFVTS